MGYLRPVTPTCYFHAGCPDGFGAAWSVWRAWGDAARFVAMGHEDPLDARRPDGDTVVFVDIAPATETLCWDASGLTGPIGQFYASIL